MHNEFINNPQDRSPSPFGLPVTFKLDPAT